MSKTHVEQLIAKKRDKMMLGTFLRNMMLEDDL